MSDPKVFTLDGNMYNLLHGQQPDAALLIRALALGEVKGLRLRDAWLNPDGTRIIVFTRNGGGNREHYNDECEAGENCHCTGCTITYDVKRDPLYVRDWDDDYDSTYAYIEYRIPQGMKDWAANLATGQVMPSLKERSEAVRAEMDKLSKEQIENDPRFKSIISSLRKVIDDAS